MTEVLSLYARENASICLNTLAHERNRVFRHEQPNLS